MTFDLEKARDLAANPIHCPETDEIFRESVAEIERLWPYEKVAADLAACGSYVGIGPGEGELPIPERVRRCVNRLKETQHEYEQKIISKDARIKELEDALVEELARGDYFDESQECEGYWWDRKNTSDCTQNDYRRNARLKLQAKGKIGPDASKPRVWQITEERKAALKRLYGLLVIRYKYSYPDETETLRSMLQEAGQ